MAGSIDRVAFVRLLPGLGDLLCAVPALRALRAEAPDARVTFVGLESSRWLAERYPELIDDHEIVTDFPGLAELGHDSRRSVAQLAAVQQRRFGLAIQAHGDGTVSNVFTALLGAERAVGPGRPPFGGADWIALPFDPRRSEAGRLIDTVAASFGRSAGDLDERLDFPVGEEDRIGAAGLAPARPFVVLHPGASRPERRWPVADFAAVGRSFLGLGLGVVVTGSDAEAELTRELAAALGPTAVDLTGRTSIGTLAAVLADAAFLVVNDTGVSHLAAGVGCPSAVVFRSSDPARWLPVGPHLAVQATVEGDELDARLRVVEAGLAALERMPDDTGG